MYIVHVGTEQQQQPHGSNMFDACNSDYVVAEMAGDRLGLPRQFAFSPGFLGDGPVHLVARHPKAEAAGESLLGPLDTATWELCAAALLGLA